MSNPHIERATTICNLLWRHEQPQRPLYVVGQSEVDHLGGWTAGGGCLGWTSAVLDLQLQTWLESCGRWQGRGGAMILCHDQTRGPGLLDTALHELAHLVEDASPLAKLPPSKLPEWVAPTVAAISKAPALPLSPEREAAVHARYHGERFARAAAHVCHRAALNGYRTTLKAMSVDNGRQVASALDLELRDRECEPISQILKSQPPVAFDRVWQSLAAA